MAEPLFILAPMDDVTDTVFRQIINSCAPADLYFTEFVNVDGLCSPGRPALMKRLLKDGEDYPVVAQIWGKRPDNFKTIANELVDMGFAGIDLNFGCPDKTVVKNGCCSAMIEPDKRELAVEIIQATIDGAAGRLPVSIKTRLGGSTIDLSWHELLLKQKLNMLTIHARTRKELSKVAPHWDAVAEIIKLRDRLSPSTKIIINGDIANRSEGERLAAELGADGVMIGRGVFADPFCLAADSPWASYTAEQRIELFRRHLQLHAATYQHGERAFEPLKKFAKIYIQSFAGASDLRAKIMQTHSIPEALAFIDTWKQPKTVSVVN